MLRPALVATALALPLPAAAHFGMILPEESMLTQQEGRSVSATFAFLHPFEQFGMDLAVASATVSGGGETIDLTDRLQPATVFDRAAFTAEVPLGRPGAYAIGLTPEPYWEPAEDVFIIHYTKTYVAAFGSDAGWDATLGHPVEIVPLTRPFGLWSGNAFQGVVTRDGEAVPHAEIEVEHWNTDAIAAPSELMITQTLRADANGVFTYVPPGPGWWGFAALSEADYTLEHEGEAKGVELGAVLWVEFQPWP